MDANALRQFVSDHPEGVVLRMVDGKEYRIPHRDYVWFTPAYGQPESRVGRFSTSFYVSEEGVGKLVNPVLVAEVMPITPNGRGTGRSGKGRSKR